MKRRLSETSDVKDQTVATLVAQQVATALLAPLTGGSAKLGKDSLARRPGPGGRKLTYIESCKAIELANRAFGFNGWSCHIVECKEEYKEKKGDRWSIGYSSLVRIELKDGTSHEDVGFGTSDGQRDLGAALEQAKKASISDARKRALRLFGEYLGNSCYDKDHIKDVNSNRPMAPLAAAPNMQTAASGSMNSGHGASTSTATASSSSSPFRPQPQRLVSSNAPPPPRMMASNYPPTIVKTEHPTAQSNAQYNMEDLSLSQFDYDPNVANSNPAKKMRS
ncbi:DNA repair protein Rad52/59/22 [Phytophthora cactorum]|nr:DNA repair protein Rad52/59/22 [Phytophthora cactorum]